MASKSVIADDTPLLDPSGLAMLNAGYGPQAAAAAQRSQDLVQALAAMRDQTNDIRTPAAPAVDRLAETLMRRRYGQSMQDSAQAARVDQPWMVPRALFGPDQPSGCRPAASAPAVRPSHPQLSFGGAVTDPTSDGLSPAWQAGAPLDGALNFDDLIPNQGAPWRPLSSDAVHDHHPAPALGVLPPSSQQDNADLEAKSGLDLNFAQNPNFPGLNGTTGSAPGSSPSAVRDASTGAEIAADSGLDGIAINPSAPPAMMFARYLMQPDEAAYGAALGNTGPGSDWSSAGASPLLPKGAIVLQTQIDVSPSALAATIEPVYRYDHTFNSLTDIHPDLSTSSVDARGGSMHIWNSTGDNIAIFDSLGYDASTQHGYIDRAYYDAYTGEYLGTYRVVNDGVPFQLTNGTVVQYDPAPTFLDKLSSAWSDSWLGQAASETWDDIAGGALGGEGQFLDSTATAASRIPAAVRFLLTGGAKGDRALAMQAALRAGQLAEADQLTALGPAGQVAIAPTQGGAKFGTAVSNDYRATFFAAHPELEGRVVVHHAVEQQALTRYPGVVSEAEMHSLENLRGIKNELNSALHNSQIRREWNRFYRANPNATRQQLLNKATEIDTQYGSQFTPPAGLPQR